MTVEIPYAVVLIVVGEVACIVVGAVHWCRRRAVSDVG
jgi:hypothetical protein